MDEIAHFKLWTPSVGLKLRTRARLVLLARNPRRLFQKLGIYDWKVFLEDVLMGASQSKAAESGILVGTSIRLGGMLENAGLALGNLGRMFLTERALGTARHAILVNAMQEFAMRTFLAHILQPLAADFTTMLSIGIVLHFEIQGVFL